MSTPMFIAESLEFDRRQETVSKPPRTASPRLVFNIKGNNYRLATAIDYRRGIVFIKWFGSHKEYDKIDVRTVQYADQAHQE
jgi:mRNA interferase HigB